MPSNSNRVNGILLSVDPGRDTGYALINLRSEDVIEAGRLDRGEPYYRERFKAIMLRAGRMVIEAQFIPAGKYNRGKKVDTKSIQKIIEAKMEAICLWIEVHGIQNVPLEVQPLSWQRPLGIATRHKSGTKDASKQVACLSTGRGIVDADMADAINMGLHAVREIIFQVRVP